MMNACLEELYDCAREALMLHPGCTASEWVDIMLSQYRMEIVDALGVDDAIYAIHLQEIWGDITDVLPK